MHSDWDVINEIFHTSNKLEFTDPVWVRGHQDDKVPFEKLSLPAQLNCRADDLANKIIQLHHRLEKPFENERLEHNAAQLIYDNGTDTCTVTRAYAQYIQSSATIPELRKYMTARFEWSEDTYDSINWDTHKLFTNHHKPQQTTLIKKLFRLFPTNKRVHLYDPLRSPQCPYCQEIKTEEHMLLCQHESKQKWRSETLKTVRTACEHIDTHIELQEILLECTHSWLNGRTFQPNDFKPHLRSLLEEQSEMWQILIRMGADTGQALSHQRCRHETIWRFLDSISFINTLWMLGINVENQVQPYTPPE